MTGPAPNFAHLLRLTDDTGLFEHARHATARREHGYCTDDVARGLMVVSREPDPPPPVLGLAECYLAFLTHAQAGAGAFHNRLSIDRRWQDEPGLGDWWGRALWGLGTAAARSPAPWIRAEARQAFMMGAARRSPMLRAMVFAGLGAAEVLRVEPDNAVAASLLADGANRVGSADGADRVGSAEVTPEWPWPEPRLTYANAALAEVVIAAGQLLRDASLLATGVRMLTWLCERQLTRGRFSVIAAGGWQRGGRRDHYDQQPIEVAALADACATASEATGDSSWETRVRQAGEWFLGDNDGGIAMWDCETGGGYDGLTPHGPNLNQGAESTLAVIATRQQVRRLS